ncbi:MAG: caspase family protein [Deltaproteobacteria bacterium]|nr:caspase family protein [Deltaproteobacteria bacterium]
MKKSIFLLVFVLIVLSGCVKPDTIPFNYISKPPLGQSEALPANLAFTSWDDTRTKIDRNNTILMFIPLVPYATTESQNGSGVNWAAYPGRSDYKEYKSWCTENPDFVPLAPRRDKDILRFICRCFKDSNIFNNAGFEDKDLLPADVDYIVQPTFIKYARKGWMTAYGTSVIGPLLYIFSLPEGGTSLDVEFGLTLVERWSGKELLNRRYNTEIDEGVYSLYSEKNVDADLALKLSPFIQESLDDFAQGVRKIMPPLTDTKYWSKVAEERNKRLANAEHERLLKEAKDTGKAPIDIYVAYPLTGIKVSEKTTVPLYGEVSSPLSLLSVKVFANGKRIPLAGTLKKGTHSISLALSRKIAVLPKENTILIEARDEAGITTTREIHVTGEPLPAGKSSHVAEPSLPPVLPAGYFHHRPAGEEKRWAVVIGISDYKDNRIPPLRYSSNDARAFYSWLISPNGGRFSQSRVKMLLDMDATGRKIRDALYVWLRQADEKDIVVIYFAGHGSPESSAAPGNLFLLPNDTEYDNIAATALPVWDIKAAIERFIKAKKVIVIADACHSYGIGKSFDISGRAVNPVSFGLRELTGIRDGICVINGSDENQLSREGTKWDGHGVFTYFLLKGLKGEADHNKDKIISIDDLNQYLFKKMSKATRGAQTPTVAGRFKPEFMLE